MIGVAVWGYWIFGRPHKFWMMLAALGVAFAWGGITAWRDKGREIRELDHYQS
jgi:hypothetical protein